MTLAALLALAGCGGERAVRVTFDVASPADTLCVLAGNGRVPDFVQRYPVDALPDPATLTFVSGSPARTTAVIAAFALEGGRVTGTGHLAVTLGAVGTLERSLRVDDCRDGAPTGLGVSPSGTFATLAPTSTLWAADYDGDGREELLAVAVDGSLAVLDAEDPDAGSRRVSELLTDGGRLVSDGDLDGDCRVDLVVAADSGVLRVLGDGTSPAPIGPSAALEATVVTLVRSAGTRVVAVSIAGAVSLDPLDGTSTTLSSEAASQTIAADLDGDGIGELVVLGPSTHLYRGGEISFVEEPGAGSGPLAPATGPLASGDFDGDGLDDVALGDGASIRVLTFGSGSLGTLSVGALTGAFTDLRRIRSADVNGDCIDDLVVLDGSTVRFFPGSRGVFVEEAGPGVTSLDLAVADVDGDGAREVALLGAGGRVTLWRP